MKKTLICTFVIPALAFSLSFQFAYGITISLQGKDAACNHNNGSITSAVSGGQPPYSYLWSSGQTVSDIDHLAPGLYHLYVTDANSVTDSASITIGNTAGLTDGTLNYLPGIFPCTNQCTGTGFLGLSSVNGTPPYTLTTNPLHQIGTYLYQNTIVPAVLGLCSNDPFTGYITDSYGCIGLLHQPPQFPPTSFNFIAEIKGACNGQPNGSAKLTLTNYNPGNYNGTIAGPSPGTINNFIDFCILSSLLSGTYTITLRNSWSSNCDTVFTLNIPDLGTNCGTISGKVYLDSTVNCVLDTTEPGIPFQLIRFTPGPFYTFSDSDGNYNAWLPFDTYTVEAINDPHFTNVCSDTGIILSLANDTISGIDLGDSTGTDLDLSVHLFSSAARPGFNYTLYVEVFNHSYIPVTNPEAVIDFGSILTFLNAGVPFTNSGPSQVTLSLPPLGSFGSNLTQLDFSIPANPGLIGSTISNMVTLNANQPELNQSNNTDVLQQIIAGSYDPNEKSVWPAADPMHHFSLLTDFVFRYTIRFQNTGTDTAFNVNLVDTLNSYLDISTIQFLGSSHPFRWEISGQNILKVHYNNILLPDSNIDETASHGLFSFSIKPKTSLHSASLPFVLENRAAIYFDFNPPVITDPAFNTVELFVGIPNNNQSLFSVVSNPVHESISLLFGDRSKIDHVLIVDLLGRPRKSMIPHSTFMNIPLDDFENGMYLIKIFGESVSGCVKFIKY